MHCSRLMVAGQHCFALVPCKLSFFILLDIQDGLNTFDKSMLIVYTIDMNKHMILRFVLACILVISPVAALPLSARLSFSLDVPLLGQDPFIGQLVEPEKGSSEAYTADALSTPYSPEWVEKFVSKDVQFSFIHSFDKELAHLLPQKMFSLGKAVKNQNTVSVPFRYGEEMRYGTFVWIEISEGRYTLVSITLNP